MMEITTKIKINCPSGFYCIRNEKKLCFRVNTDDHDYPYCEVFYPLLKKDRNGNVLKCEECLLAERTVRINA